MPYDKFGNPCVVKSRGINAQGNRWDSRDFGPNAPHPNPFHYSNRRGGFYYSNANGLTYHDDGRGNCYYDRYGSLGHGYEDGGNGSRYAPDHSYAHGHDEQQDIVRENQGYSRTDACPDRKGNDDYAARDNSGHGHGAMTTPKQTARRGSSGRGRGYRGNGRYHERDGRGQQTYGYCEVVQGGVQDHGNYDYRETVHSGDQDKGGYYEVAEDGVQDHGHYDYVPRDC